jgi:hypothetical protein
MNCFENTSFITLRSVYPGLKPWTWQSDIKSANADRWEGRDPSDVECVLYQHNPMRVVVHGKNLVLRQRLSLEWGCIDYAGYGHHKVELAFTATVTFTSGDSKQTPSPPIPICGSRQ